jgi:hypothetical protein
MVVAVAASGNRSASLPIVSKGVLPAVLGPKKLT